MEEYLKELKSVLILIEDLKEKDKEEFEKIKHRAIELLEIQTFKKEFIENIQRYNKFKNLNTLNSMLKMVMDK